MNHSCHICSIGFADFPLLLINTADNVFTAFWTVALRTSGLSQLIAATVLLPQILHYQEVGG